MDASLSVLAGLAHVCATHLARRHTLHPRLTVNTASFPIFHARYRRPHFHHRPNISWPMTSFLTAGHPLVPRIFCPVGATDAYAYELQPSLRPEPAITAQDEVKVKVIRVGICGTDRTEVSGGRADAPDGQKELVIGHEMFGQVVGLGSSVTRVKVGDFAVFTVRRGCGQCPPCQMGRADMCQTGKYQERGIHGMDGYQTQFVVDKEQYIVSVPAELEPVAC